MKIDLQVPNAGEWPPRSLSSLPRPHCSASPLSLRRGLWPHRGVCALPQRPSLCPWAPTRCRWRTAPLAAPSTWKTTRRGGGWSDAAPCPLPPPPLAWHPKPTLACAIGGANVYVRARKCECDIQRNYVWMLIQRTVYPNARRHRLMIFPRRKEPLLEEHHIIFFLSFCIITLTCWVVRFMQSTCSTPMSDSIKFFFVFFSPNGLGVVDYYLGTEDAILEDLDCQNVFIWLDYKYSGADRNFHTTTNFYCKQSITSSDHCSPFASSWILKGPVFFFYFIF